MLPIMDELSMVLLVSQWEEGKWVSYGQWVPLMPKSKAALIVEAFDHEDTGRFLILSDWMEDAGEPASEIQRFRDGNWHDQDYAHATITLFWRQIQDFRNCPSLKVFIRLLRANLKYDKFLKWYSNTFSESQKSIYEMMLDSKKFDKLYGQEARDKIKYRYPIRYTESELRIVCDYAKEICYHLHKKADLNAWGQLWKNRHWYITNKPFNWEKTSP